MEKIGHEAMPSNRSEHLLVFGEVRVTLTDCQSELDDLRDAYDLDTILLTAGRHGARTFYQVNEHE